MTRLYSITLFLFFTVSSFGQTNTLVWSDEFDTETLNTANWNYEFGNGSGGWGNNEKEYYTSLPGNISVANGLLTITAKKEAMGGCNYTSARILTKDKLSWKYGRIEMKAKLPAGKGTWPAFWMLPDKQIYGSNYWPDNGEIDIMEYVGYNPGTVYGTVHMHAFYGGTAVSTPLPFNGIENDFHVYAIEWTPDVIRFYVDEYLYKKYQRLDQAWDKWPFDQNFFIIINLAIGGNWGGAQGIDDAIFPVSYLIDYVRVYKMDITPVNNAFSSQKEITASPNPTTGYFKLQLPERNAKGYDISVYDSIGKNVISTFNCKNEYADVNLTNLPAGIYIVHVKNDSGLKTIKVLKK